MAPVLVFLIFTTLPLTWTLSTQYYGNTKYSGKSVSNVFYYLYIHIVIKYTYMYVLIHALHTSTLTVNLT